MGRIPEATIRQILESTDTVAVIQDKVRLTKKGGRWMGLCPFHSEKTPSFSVDAERGLFYCFGCQKGGTVVDFLMETDKLSYIEAIRELARRSGIEVREETEADSQEELEKNALFSLYDKIANTFGWFLATHPSGKRARDILHARGIGDDLIKRFRLGYSPADRRWLHSFLLKKGYSAAFLARSGFFAASSPGFPLFADRIMFPIADIRGRIIAFGGRLIAGDGPKYINSPDTAIFRKQDNLFALDRAADSIKAENRALVCEGYMDALSFHAAGLTCAVAPLGTAFTSRQAALLRRRADKVLLCFDADDAGRKAAERACSLAAAVGLETEVVRMSAGKDPSEILEKQGAEALKKVVDSTINGGDFLIRRARELFDTGTVEGKAKAVTFLYPYIDALDMEIKRQAFLERASRQIGANPVSLKADYEAARSSGAIHSGMRPNVPRHVQGEVNAPLKGAARTGDLVLMAAAILSGTGFDRLQGLFGPGDLDDSRARDLYLALEEASHAGVTDTQAVLALVGDDAARRFVLSTAASGELSEGLDRLMADGIRNVRMRSLERRRERVVAALAELGTGGADSEGSRFAAGEYDPARTAAAGSGEGRPPEIDGDARMAGAPALVELLAEKMRLDAELARMKGEVDERY